MRVLLHIPGVLSSLLLAAHFLHADQPRLAALCTLMPLAMLFRLRWITRLVELILLTGTLVWLWTMMQLAAQFQEMGRPSTRMIVILSSVAAFTAVSAVLLHFVVKPAVVRAAN